MPYQLYLQAGAWIPCSGFFSEDSGFSGSSGDSGITVFRRFRGANEKRRKMEKFEVTILGCGSALPTLRHLGTAQVVDIRNKYFLVDCTEGVQLALRRNRINLNRINTVLISHLHGDHCFGLVGYVSTMALLGRKAPLHVYGPKDLEKVFRPQIAYFCSGMEYEVVFHEVDTTKAAVIYEDRSLSIESIPLHHRVACCGYCFREKQGRPHMRHGVIDRYGIPYSQVNNIKAGQDFMTADGVMVPHTELTTPPDPARSYAFCSDTAYLPAIADQLKGVDLLYHEATYGEDNTELAARYCHSTARQAAMIAKAAGAGKLIIGHYSQRYDDEQVLLREAQEVFPETILAEEGKSIEVRSKR